MRTLALATAKAAFPFQSLFWSPGYDYVVAQDENGDGQVDVVLYNSATGTEYTGLRATETARSTILTNTGVSERHFSNRKRIARLRMRL